MGREGFPGLDAEVVIAKVYVVCPLGGWGRGEWGEGVGVSWGSGGSIWLAPCWRMRASYRRAPVRSSVVRKNRSRVV